MVHHCSRQTSGLGNIVAFEWQAIFVSRTAVNLSQHFYCQTIIRPEIIRFISVTSHGKDQRCSSTFNLTFRRNNTQNEADELNYYEIVTNKLVQTADEETCNKKKISVRF
jgi:hypothetical protein